MHKPNHAKTYIYRTVSQISLSGTGKYLSFSITSNQLQQKLAREVDALLIGI